MKLTVASEGGGYFRQYYKLITTMEWRGDALGHKVATRTGGMNRRNFLRGSGLAAAACALGGVHARGQETEKRAPVAAGSFTFAFFTDVHIEPEMDAPQGTELAMEIINASDAEFAICGGDHVFDALSADKERIIEQYELYAQAEKTLRIPVRHVLGNHDVAGLKTDMSSHDAIYGKAMFEQTFQTPTYYSFQHKGVNFIVLDSDSGGGAGLASGDRFAAACVAGAGSGGERSVSADCDQPCAAGDEHGQLWAGIE